MREIKAKYCPRTKHSTDMPLKWPRRNCGLKSRDGRHCMFTACVIKYCEANGIKITMDLQVVCILEDD